MKNDKWNYDNIDYEWLFICRIGLKNYIFKRAKIIGTKYQLNLMASSHENLFGCTKLKKEKFSDIKHNLILICCGKLTDICAIYNIITSPSHL